MKSERNNEKHMKKPIRRPETVWKTGTRVGGLFLSECERKHSLFAVLPRYYYTAEQYDIL